MLVTEIMSRDVLTLPPDAGPAEAVRLMDEHDMRHLPIVEGGKLVGLVSDRDLLAATGWMPGRPGSDAAKRQPQSLRQVMHAPVKTLAPKDHLVSASLELILHGIGCMPVLDQGKLAGIVTETDLLRAFVRASRAGKLTGEHDPPVGKLMTRRPTTIRSDATLKEAANEMHLIRTRHLLVVDERGRVVGLLSDRDLRWAAGREQAEGTPVEDLMSGFLISVQPSQPTTMAAGLMLEHKVSALPVIDEGELAGIVTSTDLLNHCMNTLWEV